MSHPAIEADNNNAPQREARVGLEYQAVLDAAVVAVVIIDQHGTIELVNHAGARMFGYRKDELVGQNVRMLMLQPYRGQHDDALERYLRTREPHIIGTGREVAVQRRDGTTVAVELSFGEINGSEPPRFVGFIRDVTDRQRVEDEIRQMRDRLTHFGRIATMGEMATGIAHEINQPLTAIATYAQACQRLLANPPGQLTDALSDITEGLAQIESQALRAGEVIRRLRSFVKNREVRREPLDPNQLLDDLLMLAQTDTRHHHVQIRIQRGGDLPIVQADPVQIQQVVLNLVRNSIDAMLDLPHEQRIIDLRTRRDENGDVEFMVSDRGPGLDASAKDALFNPFFTTKTGGTGLGLAISQSIVRSHGGKVWHRENEHGGACFLFSLPAAIPQSHA
jgi:two-component system sensor kinase FixL